MQINVKRPVEGRRHRVSRHFPPRKASSAFGWSSSPNWLVIITRRCEARRHHRAAPLYLQPFVVDNCRVHLGRQIRDTAATRRPRPSGGDAVSEFKKLVGGPEFEPRSSRPNGRLTVAYGRLIKQKQYSSTPPEPSPGARKCSLSTMWL